MAATEGVVDVRLAAPGPWAPRRIPFLSTSTYASAPTMEPLNQPVGRTDGANASYRLGNGPVHYQDQQQSTRQISKNVASGNGNLRRTEPLSLPSNMPLQWTAPQKIGAGLSNLGNTCFLNSVLQCLTYTPPLAGYLQSGHHKNFCRVAGFCAFCALQEHVQQALASSGKIVSPQKMAKNLRSICRSFKMGRQEDSHEYMRYLLDALHKCCLPPDLAENSNSKSSQEKSLVYRIFGGQLRSQVKCTVCSYCSNTYDPFLDLSLEISRADSLLKALSRFTDVDVLDGDNKYKCLHCKKAVRALKCFTIDSIPNILTIQFKRFAGGQGGKIDKRVDFQTTLDLSPYVSSGMGGSLKYKLFGVLVHSGWSTHSGHYYSFLRASSDIWHVFDDTRVRQVSEQTVLEQKAYMLFYVRDIKKARIPDTESASTAWKVAAAAAQTSQLQMLVPADKERHSTNDDAGRTHPSKQAPSCAAHGRAFSQEMHEAKLPATSERNVPTEMLVPAFVNGQDSTVAVENDCPRDANAGRVQVPAQSLPTANHLRDDEDGHREGPTKRSNESSSADGVVPSTSTSPVCPEGKPLDHPAPSSLDESVRPGPLPDAVKDHGDLKAKRSGCESENSPTSSSSNQSNREDWDDYYTKVSTNGAGSAPPPKYMKILKLIPHTRRYYQARTPVRRSNKASCNGSNADLPLSAVSPTGSSVETGKDLKRPYACDEYANARENKKQHRESILGRVSSTCMAMEELCRSDEVYETPSEEHGQGEQQEGGLKPQVKERPGESEIMGDSVAGDDSGQRAEIADIRHPSGMSAEDSSKQESTAQGILGHGLQVTFVAEKELQNVANDRRAKGSGNDYQTREAGPPSGADAAHASSTTGVELTSKTSCKTEILMDGTSLYDDSVPRWGDVDTATTRDVNQLLNAETNRSAKQDEWDVEYDRGRQKKVRSKVSRESSEGIVGTYGTGDGAPRSSNPFQTFGPAKKRSVLSVKKGNSIGFKAGYGLSLKTGRSNFLAGNHTTKSS